MKLKNFFLCLTMGAMAMFNTSCGDDDLKPSEVPAAVMATFQEMFPNTTAKWEKEKNGQIKAEFRIDYREMEAWFEKNGSWKMTKKDIIASELPQAALDYLEANYSGVEIDDVDWVETPESNYYIVELDRNNKKDIYLKFTESGEFIQ